MDTVEVDTWDAVELIDQCFDESLVARSVRLEVDVPGRPDGLGGDHPAAWMPARIARAR